MQNVSRGFVTAFGVIVALAATAMVANLAVLLAEERRPRLAVLRALGLTRGGLIQLSVTEGALYSLAGALRRPQSGDLRQFRSDPFRRARVALRLGRRGFPDQPGHRADRFDRHLVDGHLGGDPRPARSAASDAVFATAAGRRGAARDRRSGRRRIWQPVSARVGRLAGDHRRFRPAPWSRLRPYPLFGRRRRGCRLGVRVLVVRQPDHIGGGLHGVLRRSAGHFRRRPFGAGDIEPGRTGKRRRASRPTLRLVAGDAATRARLLVAPPTPNRPGDRGVLDRDRCAGHRSERA
ncbi:MAG: ABC transporter permease [Chloroflexi bacterium]|nr:MAG: ABC transporter permease [Chloroflexota bacterium]